MLNINGKVRIMKFKDISQKLATATIYYGVKKGEEFVTTFIDAKLVGNAFTKMSNIKEKDQIYITTGMFEMEEYNKRKYPRATIFDFVFGDDIEKEENTQKKLNEKPTENKPKETKTKQGRW